MTETQKLQNLQRRATRIITGSNYDAPSKPLIETLGWRIIEKLIQSEARVMVFKSVSGLSPHHLTELFVTIPVYIFPVVSKNISCSETKSFQFTGAALWNGLPFRSKQVSSFVAFKKSI